MDMEYKSVILDELNQKGVCVYTTEGDSMEPFLSNRRDVVIIRRKNPGERLKRYDVALYKRERDSYFVLHRVFKVREGEYVICADNRWRLERGVTDEQIVGVLSGVRRKGKDISLDSINYRLYVHIWYAIYPLRAIVMMGKEHVWKIINKKKP